MRARLTDAYTHRCTQIDETDVWTGLTDACTHRYDIQTDRRAPTCIYDIQTDRQMHACVYIHR